MFGFQYSGVDQYWRGVQYGASPVATTSDINPVTSTLLQEDGFFLLQEDGSFILLT